METQSLVETIPGYRLVKEIGRGAFGVVWLAEESMTGVRRAVKVLPKSRTTSQSRELDGIRKFQQIAQGHGDTIQILHVGETPDCYYYAMELADTISAAEADDEDSYSPLTLKHVIESAAPLDPRRALDYIERVLCGLQHLHAKGLLHRDVKPANILFVNGKPKLGDLGLVTTANRDVTQVGTLGYMPPGAKVDQTSDIYATGMVLYEMITGLSFRDFPSLSDRRLQSRSERRAFQIANQAAIQAARAIPDQRFQSATAMLDFIKRSRSGDLQIRRWTAVIVAAVILALATTLGVAWKSPHGIESKSGESEAQFRIVASRALRGPDGNPGQILELQFGDGTVRNFRFGSNIQGSLPLNLVPGESLVAVGFCNSGDEAGKLLVYDGRRCRIEGNPTPVFDQRFCDLPPDQWNFQEYPKGCSVSAELSVDLDGVAGDELVLAVFHDPGPCELVILARDFKRLGSFWHYGWINAATDQPAVYAADLDGNGRKSLICLAIANRRDDPSRKDSYPEPYHTSVFVLRPDELRREVGFWGMNEWLHEGSQVTPAAHGYIKHDWSSGSQAWRGSRLEIIGEGSRAIVRIYLNQGLAIDLDRNLSPIRCKVINKEDWQGGPVPMIEEVWTRTWPPANPLPPGEGAGEGSAKDRAASRE